MIKNRPRLAFLAGVLFLSPTLFAAQGPYPSTPKAVIEQYARLDAQAAGLSAQTWPELGQLTTIPQAPKWESFVVIDRYEVGKALEAHTRAQVRVTYYPLGKLSETFTPGTQAENVTFYLVKANGQWKVDNPPLVPHVSYTVMKQRLSAGSAANPKEKKANDALLAQIEGVRQGVHP